MFNILPIEFDTLCNYLRLFLILIKFKSLFSNWRARRIDNLSLLLEKYLQTVGKNSRLGFLSISHAASCRNAWISDKRYVWWVQRIRQSYIAQYVQRLHRGLYDMCAFRLFAVIDKTGGRPSNSGHNHSLVHFWLHKVFWCLVTE